MISCRCPSFLLLPALLLILSIATADGAPGDITTVAGGGVIGPGGFPKHGFFGDGLPATQAVLGSPAGIFIDAAGQLFISDFSNHRIRKVSPDGFITTIAGNGLEGISDDDVLATEAYLGGSRDDPWGGPWGVFVDVSGHLYFTEWDSGRLRRIDQQDYITTIAAWDSTTSATMGNDRIAPGTLSRAPSGIYLDTNGNLYIADLGAQSIHMIDSTGTITTIAGNGIKGFSGDGGPATEAQLHFPNDVFGDRRGNLLISDSGNNRIRKVSPEGIITTIAGNGIKGFSGDGGPATEAQLSFPHGLFVDAAGNLFVSDWGNYRIRMVDSTGTITTVAGTGKTPGFSGDGGPATEAKLFGPTCLFVDAAGNLFISDSGNNCIRMVESIAAPTVVNSGVFWSPTTDITHPATTDSTAPLLLSSSPMDGAINVDLLELNQRGIYFLFSEPIDTTIMKSSLHIDGEPQWWIPSVTGDTLKFTRYPWESFPGDKEYQITISGIRDSRGNVAPDISLTFTTQVDTTAPSLLSSFPADGAANVDLATLNRSGILLTFDEPIDTTYMQISFRGVASFSLSFFSHTQGGRLTFVPLPDHQLHEGKRYQLLASQIQDQNGNIANDIIINFSTSDESIPPVLSHTWPSSGDWEVDPEEINVAGISLFFSEPIDTTRFTYTLQQDQQRILTWSPQWQGSSGNAMGDTLVFLFPTPGNELEYGHSYQLMLPEVFDLFGNRSEPFELSFRTMDQAPDTLAPSLIFSSPADGTVDLAPAQIDTQGIVLIFDEPVDLSSLIARISGNQVDIPLLPEWENDLQALRLRPKEKGIIQANTSYRVQLMVVKDLAGNVTRDIQFTFSTFTDSTFTDSTFTDSTFTDSTFTDSTFTDSTFTDSTFTDSTFTDSTFTDSTFTDSTFTDSTFTDSTFTGEFGREINPFFEYFFLFADHFGTQIKDDNWDPAFDYDDSGKVDYDDFFIFSDHFDKLVFDSEGNPTGPPELIK